MFMTIFITALCSFFTITYVILPVRAYQRKRVIKDLEKEYEKFKLRTVRNHYTPLQELSYEEIKERYRISDAYNKIR